MDKTHSKKRIFSIDKDNIHSKLYTSDRAVILCVAFLNQNFDQIENKYSYDNKVADGLMVLVSVIYWILKIYFN